MTTQTEALEAAAGDGDRGRAHVQESRRRLCIGSLVTEAKGKSDHTARAAAARALRMCNGKSTQTQHRCSARDDCAHVTRLRQTLHTRDFCTHALLDSTQRARAHCSPTARALALATLLAQTTDSHTHSKSRTWRSTRAPWRRGARGLFYKSAQSPARAGRPGSRP